MSRLILNADGSLRLHANGFSLVAVDDADGCRDCNCQPDGGGGGPGDRLVWCPYVRCTSPECPPPASTVVGGRGDGAVLLYGDLPLVFHELVPLNQCNGIRYTRWGCWRQAGAPIDDTGTCTLPSGLDWIGSGCHFVRASEYDASICGWQADKVYRVGCLQAGGRTPTDCSDPLCTPNYCGNQFRRLRPCADRLGCPGDTSVWINENSVLSFLQRGMAVARVNCRDSQNRIVTRCMCVTDDRVPANALPAGARVVSSSGMYLRCCECWDSFGLAGVPNQPCALAATYAYAEADEPERPCCGVATALNVTGFAVFGSDRWTFTDPINPVYGPGFASAEYLVRVNGAPEPNRVRIGITCEDPRSRRCPTVNGQLVYQFVNPAEGMAILGQNDGVFGAATRFWGYAYPPPNRAALVCQGLSGSVSSAQFVYNADNLNINFSVSMTIDNQDCQDCGGSVGLLTTGGGCSGCGGGWSNVPSQPI